MNPQDIDTAEWISRALGDKEVTLKSRGRSVTAGKATTSYSEEVRTVPLISGSRINGMRTGEAILVNPHFVGGGEGFIPVKTKIELSSRYRKLIDWSGRAWENSIRPGLIQKRGSLVAISEEDLLARQAEVDRMFPDTLLKKDSGGDLFTSLL